MALPEVGARAVLQGADAFFGDARRVEEALRDIYGAAKQLEGSNGAENALRDIGRAGETAAGDINKFEKELRSVDSAAKEAQSGAKAAEGAIKELGKAAGDADSKMNSAASEAKDLGSAAKGASGDIRSAETSIEALGTAAGTADSKMNAAAGEARELGQAAKTAGGDLKTASDNMKSAGDHAGDVGTKAGAATPALTGMGTAATGASRGMGDMAKQGIATGGAILGMQLGVDGIRAALGGTIGAFMSFEHQMSAVGAVSGATADELEGMSQKALEIGANTSLGASEAAAAMEILAANGISARDIIDGAAEAAVALAEAGGTDLATAADVVSTAMGVWGHTTQDLTKDVNLLAGVANVSRFGVEDMAGAIAQGGGAAAVAGVSFEDFSTVIAATATNFSSGSDAGTSFKTMVGRLDPDTAPARKAMEELGIITADGANAFFDAQGNLKDMADVTQILHDALGPLTEQQRLNALQTIFGNDALRSAAGLAQLTAAEFTAMQTTMANTSAADVAKQRLDNVAGSVEGLKGNMETLGIQMGSHMAPAFQALVELLSGAIGKFTEMDGSTQALVLSIGGLAAALPAAVALIGSLSSMFQSASVNGLSLNAKLALLGAGLGLLLVGVDQILKRTTDHGLMDYLFGDIAKADAAIEAMRRWTVEAHNLATAAERADLAIDQLNNVADDAAKFLLNIGVAAKDSSGYLDGLGGALLGTDARFFGFNVGLSTNTDKMKEMQAQVEFATQKYIENGGSLANLVDIYQKLPPPLQESMNKVVDMGAVMAANQKTTTDYSAAVADMGGDIIEAAGKHEVLTATVKAAPSFLETYRLGLQVFKEEVLDNDATAKAFKESLDALTQTYGAANPEVVRMQAENVRLKDNIEDLKNSTEELTAEQQAQIAEWEAIIAANDAASASYADIGEDIEGVTAHLTSFIGDSGMGGVLAKMQQVGVEGPAAEEHIHTLDKAFSDLQQGGVADAIAGIRGLHTELQDQPELWAVIAEAIGPAFIGQVHEGVADPNARMQILLELHSLGLASADDLRRGLTEGGAAIDPAVRQLAEDMLAAWGTGSAGASEKGAETGGKLADGVSSKKPDIDTAGYEAAKAALEGWHKGSEPASDEGAATGTAFAGGVEETAPKANDAGKKVGEESTSGMETGSESSAEKGRSTGGRYALGLEDTKGQAEGAGQRVATASIGPFQNIDLYTAGYNAGSGFARGLEGARAIVTATASSIANAAISVVDQILENSSPSRRMFESGAFAGEGLALGMQSMLPTVSDSASSVANAIITAINGLLQISSPSQVMYTSGVAVGEGVADGITDTIPEVDAAAQLLATVATQAIAMGMSPIVVAAIANNGLQALLDAIAAFEGPAQEAGGIIGDAVSYGVDEGIDDAALYDTGVEVVSTVVDGIVSEGPRLTEEMENILGALIPAIESVLDGAGEVGVAKIRSILADWQAEWERWEDIIENWDWPGGYGPPNNPVPRPPVWGADDDDSPVNDRGVTDEEVINSGGRASGHIAPQAEPDWVLVGDQGHSLVYWDPEVRDYVVVPKESLQDPDMKLSGTLQDFKGDKTDWAIDWSQLPPDAYITSVNPETGEVTYTTGSVAGGDLQFHSAPKAIEYSREYSHGFDPGEFTEDKDIPGLFYDSRGLRYWTGDSWKKFIEKHAQGNPMLDMLYRPSFEHTKGSASEYAEYFRSKFGQNLQGWVPSGQLKIDQMAKHIRDRVKDITVTDQSMQWWLEQNMPHVALYMERGLSLEEAIAYTTQGGDNLKVHTTFNAFDPKPWVDSVRSFLRTGFGMADVRKTSQFFAGQVQTEDQIRDLLLSPLDFTNFDRNLQDLYKNAKTSDPALAAAMKAFGEAMTAARKGPITDQVIEQLLRLAEEFNRLANPEKEPKPPPRPENEGPDDDDAETPDKPDKPVPEKPKPDPEKEDVDGGGDGNGGKPITDPTKDGLTPAEQLLEDIMGGDVSPAVAAAYSAYRRGELTAEQVLAVHWATRPDPKPNDNELPGAEDMRLLANLINGLDADARRMWWMSDQNATARAMLLQHGYNMVDGYVKRVQTPSGAAASSIDDYSTPMPLYIPSMTSSGGDFNITVDLSNSQFMGTPQENADAVRAAVEQVLREQQRDAYQVGVTTGLTLVS